MKGIGDLAVLLARPGVEVHALELMGGRDVGGAAGPALDERARRAYQARIVELQRDIDEARADNDHGRAERAELELDALVEQLSEAFGLGGRSRTTGSSAERARTAVTYRVRSAIRKLAELHPDLGRHLGQRRPHRHVVLVPPGARRDLDDRAPWAHSVRCSLTSLRSGPRDQETTA